jgi:hypothetical protein
VPAGREDEVYERLYGRQTARTPTARDAAPTTPIAVAERPARERRAGAALGTGALRHASARRDALIAVLIVGVAAIAMAAGHGSTRHPASAPATPRTVSAPVLPVPAPRRPKPEATKQPQRPTTRTAPSVVAPVESPVVVSSLPPVRSHVSHRGASRSTATRPPANQTRTHTAPPSHPVSPHTGPGAPEPATGVPHGAPVSGPRGGAQAPSGRSGGR